MLVREFKIGQNLNYPPFPSINIFGVSAQPDAGLPKTITKINQIFFQSPWLEDPRRIPGRNEYINRGGAAGSGALRSYNDDDDEESD